jgi:hypothetical protein
VRTGYSKEELVRDIARRDGVREGLICVLSALEPCNAFDVRGDHKTRRLQIVRRLRKCLHFYFYFLDPEFGFIHVRLQSWLPFTIQIYVNGHEWLCRQLDRRRSRLYRVTPRGYRLMSAVLTFRQVYFPQAFTAAA